MPIPMLGAGLRIIASGQAIIVVGGDKAENRISICAWMALAMALIGVLGLLARTGFATLWLARSGVAAGAAMSFDRSSGLASFVRAARSSQSARTTYAATRIFLVLPGLVV